MDDPDIGFSRLAGVDIDRDGNVYALESLVPEIRVYDAKGVLHHRIGGRGGGPGEFEGTPQFGVKGDTVWAIDTRLNRITLFKRDGTVLSTGPFERVTVPLPSGYGYVIPRVMRPDGKFTGHMSGVGGGGGSEPTDVGPTDSIPVPFVLFEATGGVTDTIGWAGRPPPKLWRPPSEYRWEMKFVDVGGRQQVLPMPPSGLPWWEPMVDGYLFIGTPLAQNPEQGVLSVTRIGLHGETLFHTPLFYRPLPYSAADLDSIAARGARGEAGGMLPIFTPGAPVPDDWPVIGRSLRAEMDFPEFQLSIEYPWVSKAGSVWLRRQDVDSPVARWVLLDPQGRPRGELELPRELQIRWHEGNTLWAVDPEEFDVPWLVRFTIEPK